MLNHLIRTYICIHYTCVAVSSDAGAIYSDLCIVCMYSVLYDTCTSRGAFRIEKPSEQFAPWWRDHGLISRCRTNQFKPIHYLTLSVHLMRTTTRSERRSFLILGNLYVAISTVSKRSPPKKKFHKGGMIYKIRLKVVSYLVNGWLDGGESMEFFFQWGETKYIRTSLFAVQYN